jgi:hypothetical protein
MYHKLKNLYHRVDDIKRELSDLMKKSQEFCNHAFIYEGDELGAHGKVWFKYCNKCTLKTYVTEDQFNEALEDVQFE